LVSVVGFAVGMSGSASVDSTLTDFDGSLGVTIDFVTGKV
jgi:hypothetical protein